MTEEEARVWLTEALDVSRGTLDAAAQFVAYLEEASATQNLIANSTKDTVWGRHIVDSAQLLPLAAPGRAWIDLGSGAGFPGLIVALFGEARVTLVESRRKRVEFLRGAVELLGLGERVVVADGRAEMLTPAVYDTISARAFAPLDRLLPIGRRFVGPQTRWLLPKGRGAQAELDAARRTWQGDFRIEPSVTDPESAIIVAEHVRPRKQR